MTGTHRAPRASQAPGAALLTRLALLTGATTGAVLAGAGGASAEIIPEDLGVGTVTNTLGVIDDATTHAINPALDLQLNPLANTTTDPLSNTVGTQVADLPPLSTGLVTGPLSEGASTRELPGALLGSLLGGGNGTAGGSGGA